MSGLIAVPAAMTGESDDPARDVAEALRSLATWLSDEDNAALVRALTAAATVDLAESESLYDRMSGPAYQWLVGRLRLAHPDDDAEALADALTGAFVYRVLTRRRVDAEYAATLLSSLVTRRVAPLREE